MSRGISIGRAEVEMGEERDEEKGAPEEGAPAGLGRGRLKIYLGWAPGTGKTRRALLDARALRAQGIDLVVGWHEPKGRRDLDDLLAGLERIPPRNGSRAGLLLSDIDLEALLRRHPATVLIDELARTGGLSGAMPRWQMVELLRDRGISVITTLNSLHISALALPAAQILGHSVGEIVPVEFVKGADELVLVDLPPGELLSRIREGSVFGANGKAAVRSPLLSERNLFQLREMTLLFAAKVLDDRLTRQGGEKGIFERVTVLVSTHPESFAPLLDYGSTLSRRLGGELLVLHLEKIPLWGRWFGTKRPLPESLAARVRGAGGKLSILRTRHVPWTLWRFVERTKTTRLVLGHAGEAHPWSQSFVRSVLHHFPRIDVEVVLVPTLHPILPESDEPPAEDSLLPSEFSRQENRGRFTLFLGAAAGIGKTYRMLQTAKEQQEKGRRVVVGFLETHGRKETEEMARGLPVIPRKMVPYRGLILPEMDVEAIVAASPELVLVDELAHTNPPGFPSAKRYQDVLGLLGRGIDVFSTLNVQHVESLNDLVELQTGIRVRETVPDGVVVMADDLVLVDLTPEELQRRLLEGKVYPPDKIVSSLENFFSTRNLTALREFALMRAQGAGSAMGRMARRGGVVLVGVSSREADQALVRRGARLTERLGLRLQVLLIREKEGGEEEAPRRLRPLVESLGGSLRIETGSPWEELFVKHCQELRPVFVILGQSAWRPGLESTAEKIARKLTAYPLLIVPLDIRDHRSPDPAR